MSGFGFGGFGANNNPPQQGSGFGGFGSNNNTGGGFGQTPNTGFGNNPPTGGGLFGSSNAGSGFGSGGFGQNTQANQPNQPNQQSLFGAPKPFGQSTTSGGGLFGSNTATAGSATGFGGFGTNTNTTNTSSAFGGGNTGGGLFGASGNKPAFGTGGSSGGLFGAGGFGTTNTQPTSAFGTQSGTALSSVTPQTDGTGSTPFQATNERESGSNHNNHFQSISFMPPYQKFSFEELRLADYAQGRKHGNGSGQAGAFGTTTGFGTFGGTPNTGGGLFAGTSNATSSPFGTQTANTGFGGNTTNSGGGLFGAKPTGSGLFGSNPTTSAQPSGGLFSTSGSTGFGTNTGTGFGGATTGGGLFGGTNTTQANNNGFKLGTGTPGAFGQANTGGFGQPNTTSGGGIFGNSNATAAPFGGGQQQQSGPAFGTFGSNPQNQNQGNTSSPFGTFGNNQQQQKPGGLFGNTGTANTGSSLFGGAPNNQQQSSGGLFGNAGNTQQAGGGLFGNLGTNNTTNAGGSLFSGLGSNQQNQQNQSGGLFGGTQQQDKPGGLFGQTTNNTNNTDGGLFGNPGGNTNNQPSGGSSLFGNLGNNNQNQQQQAGSLFGNNSSILGSSQQNQQQQGLLASLTDQTPYGSQSIFSGLPPPSQPNMGPIATPLSTGQKMKKSAILPQYKMNPNAASRLVTPQNRGFGFTYSTYGTPSSISSVASTPGGLSSGLLGGSFGRSLGKSFSTSNLRRTFDSASDSLLSPGAFSASNSLHSGSSSLKILAIDRNLRVDLFGRQPLPALPSSDKTDQSKQPSILKKKVSFDSGTVGGNGNGRNFGNGRSFGNNKTNGALTRIDDESPTPSAEEQGFLRSSTHANSNGVKLNGIAPQPEMEQVKGNELAIVPEDGTPARSMSSSSQSSDPATSPIDPQPGKYYMNPSREQLQAMTGDQLKQVSGFIVGRHGCGHVRFDQPVDLTTVDLDSIYNKIVVIETRSLTVYADPSTKPPVGKGLNVPSTITLENSWPRSVDKKSRSYERSGPRFDKHVLRLQRVTGTDFVKYDKNTGEWVFTVPHFTTYKLDYDEYETDGEDPDVSMLSAPPDTPTPNTNTSRGLYSQTSNSQHNSSMFTEESARLSSGPDDTFAFKNKKVLPGAFDEEVVDEEDLTMSDAKDIEDSGSLSDLRSADSPLENIFEKSTEAPKDSTKAQQSSDVVAEQGLQGMNDSMMSQPIDIRGGGDTPLMDSLIRPKSILKSRQQQSQFGLGTPRRAQLEIGDNWANQLQRTVSPRKQDRQALRERQGTVLKERDDDREATPTRKLTTNGNGNGFATRIDLMNSLFGPEPAQKFGQGTKQGSKEKEKGFEWPYPKRPKTFDGNDSEMPESDQAFHDSQKPSWGPDSTLIYAMASKGGLVRRSKSARMSSTVLEQKGLLVSEGKDLCFAKYAVTPDLTPETLEKQRAWTSIATTDGVPHAQMPSTNFDQFSQLVDGKDQRSNHERLVWELAHILFDDYDDEISTGVPKIERPQLQHRIRKDRLSRFWQRLVQDSATKAVAAAPTAEERAIAHLSANNIEEACSALLEGKDFRLAALVAQIRGSTIMREDIGDQINEWRGLNVLSEFTEPIRALYELLAGNTCVCEGKKGPLEDRAKTFVMSDRFGLDWRRAFGLRLWYAIDADEPIEAAIRKFSKDMEGGNEQKKPLPWFTEQGLEPLWDDERATERVDLLWGLLDLFARGEKLLAMEIAHTIMPENVSRNSVDTRLSFQLYHALTGRAIGERTMDVDDIDNDPSDKLAWSFATQLEAAGQWVWAAFAILHLSSTRQRHQALQSLIAQHANDIGDTNSAPFRTLRDEFKIPDSWIWEAKALHARSVEQNHIKEVDFLLKAKNWDEAHKTLCRIVAPRAIIEQDYQTLSNLLDGFENKGAVEEWSLGGQVFQDFIALVHEGNDNGLERLLAALPALVNERPGKLGFMEMVAVQEMSGIVGKRVLEGKRNAADGAKVLQLPLTEDAYLKHTMDLSLQYYRAVMAGGR